MTKDMAFLRDYILHGVVNSLYEYLKTYQAALFYAYDDGVIFSQRGSEEMLRQLNAMNIGIGTCIKEECLGTTAASLTLKPNQEACVVGDEHYLDIFAPFASYCFYSEDFNGRSYTLVFLPRESLTKHFIAYFRLFHSARKATLGVYRKNLELTMKNELFEQLMHNKHEAFLFLDSFGKVIYFNQIFATWFKVSLDESKNINCLEIIPELDRALTCLETGHRIMFEEIFLRKAPEQKQFLRMDVTPITQDDLITGLSIKLSDSGNVRQTVNKIANSQAYYTFENIIGESSAIRQVKERAVNIAKSRSSVIITGESGTGKELFAQAIHNKSIRRDNPFVALNCAAIPSELIASELFGHVEGAFTGARKGGSMGKFEYAHQGTLFLDEIGELPMYAQTMLLRVLEERTVTRIGSNITTPVDVRLICATNRDLRKMVNEGAFRLDLYYRINVIHLHLPPLRDRVTDIPLMLDYFIDYFNEVLDKNVQQVSPKALSYLVRCAWPGNLREFRNAVECAVNNVEGTTLKLEDLPGDIFDQLDSDEVGKAKQFTNSETDFWKEERKKILSTLIKYNGNKSQVAEELNVSRSTLYKKIREYKLD